MIVAQIERVSATRVRWSTTLPSGVKCSGSVKDEWHASVAIARAFSVYLREQEEGPPTTDAPTSAKDVVKTNQ